MSFTQRLPVQLVVRSVVPLEENLGVFIWLIFIVVPYYFMAKRLSYLVWPSFLWPWPHFLTRYTGFNFCEFLRVLH